MSSNININYKMPADYPAATITTTINLEGEKEKSSAYIPGRIFYIGLEMYMHSLMVNRCHLDEMGQNVGEPLYRTTYLTAFAAGMVFGLVKAIIKKEEPGLDKRAAAFSVGNLTQKAIVAAEAIFQGPLALRVAENLNPEFGGSLVAAFWGFSLGADLSRWSYKKIQS